MPDFKSLVQRAQASHSAKEEAAQAKAAAESLSREEKRAKGLAVLNSLVKPIFEQASQDVKAAGFAGQIETDATHYPAGSAMYLQLKSPKIYNSGGGHVEPKSEWIGYASDGKDVFSCACSGHYKRPHSSDNKKIGEESDISAEFSLRLEQSLSELMDEVAKARKY